MIPNCLNLRQDQIDKLNKWKESQKRPTLDEHDEMYGGACLTSLFYFKIRETSIVTEILVINEFTGEKCNLTIDDDNELVE